MITLPQMCVVLASGCALTFGLARWDIDEMVAERVNDLVAIEIRELEAYVDSRMPSFERGVELGELAVDLCSDYFAGPAVLRVQKVSGKEGVCR